MDLQILLVIFVGLTALAFAAQAIGVLLIYRKIDEAVEKINPLVSEAKGLIGEKGKIAALADQVTEVVERVKPIAEHAQTISSNITSASIILRNRAEDLDYFIGETINTARLQVARVNDLVNTTASKFDETVTMVQHGVVAPVSEIAAVVRGIRAGLLSFFSRRRNGSQLNRVAQDEELFI
jgi:hypothetical protein